MAEKWHIRKAHSDELENAGVRLGDSMASITLTLRQWAAVGAPQDLLLVHHRPTPAPFDIG